MIEHRKLVLLRIWEKEYFSLLTDLEALHKREVKTKAKMETVHGSFGDMSRCIPSLPARTV